MESLDEKNQSVLARGAIHAASLGATYINWVLFSNTVHPLGLPARQRHPPGMGQR